MTRSSRILPSLVLALCAVQLNAGGFMDNPAEVTAMLTGKQLQGTYLRTQSPYSLHFKADGTLVNQRDEKGKWWINEQGQYCREWFTGRLTGNRSCMNLAMEDGVLVFYSKQKRVATGNLSAE
ncbi:MAG: hypothetical protein ABW082_15640 [Sedimenticola sp.]